MLKNANLAKVIIATVVNKIGALADMSRILSEHGINISAVAGYAENKNARIMLVTDDHLRASDTLKKNGYNSIVEEEIIMLELEDKPGALKNVTAKLASEGIDIKYTYGTTCPGGCPPRLVLSTSDNEKALVAFRK